MTIGKKRKDDVAVLIPCYNEAQTIGKVIEDFKKNLGNAKIYVYDNNSTDKTAEIAENAGAIVRHEYRQGKGNVVRRMFQEIEANCYVLVDGDDTYPSEAAKSMTDLVLKKKTDMVVGDRLSSTYYEQNKRPFHNFGNSLVRRTINMLFGADIKDIMTGYRAFSHRFVKTFPVLSKGFEIESEMSIHAIVMNMAIENVIIQYRDRPVGSESKLNTTKDGLRVLRTIMKLFRNYKPLSFFSGIAAIMLLIDLVVLLFAIFIPFAETGLVERFPTLIVGSFVAVASLLLFVCGLILDSLWQKERREFEFRLMQVEK